MSERTNAYLLNIQEIIINLPPSNLSLVFFSVSYPQTVRPTVNERYGCGIYDSAYGNFVTGFLGPSHVVQLCHGGGLLCQNWGSQMLTRTQVAEFQAFGGYRDRISCADRESDVVMRR